MAPVASRSVGTYNRREKSKEMRRKKKGFLKNIIQEAGKKGVREDASSTVNYAAALTEEPNVFPPRQQPNCDGVKYRQAIRGS